MSNSINLAFIEKWINNVSIYPPAEIFFQAPKSQEPREEGEALQGNLRVSLPLQLGKRPGSQSDRHCS